MFPSFSDNGARLTPPLVQLLDLSHNFISRIPYQVTLPLTLTFYFPSNLTFTFSSIKLTSLHMITLTFASPQFLSALSPSLRSLDISYNQLTDLDGSSLENLSNLQILRLD